MTNEEITPTQLNKAFRKNFDNKFSRMIELVKHHIDTGLNDFVAKPTTTQINSGVGSTPHITFTIGHATCGNLPSDEVMQTVIQSYRDDGFKCTYELIDGDRSYDYYVVAFYENN